jgi:hypothetical protein
MLPARQTTRRTPLRMYIFAVVIGVAAISGAFSATSSWYAYSGVLPTSDFNTTFVQHYTPGPSGYITTCETYFSSHITICGLLDNDYSAGNGSELQAGLWYGILASSVAIAVLAFAGDVALVSSMAGTVRVRRARRVLTVCVVTGIVVMAAALVAVPALQGAALRDVGTCVGYASGPSPCNSFFGHVSGAECTAHGCAEENLSWYPEAGWYLGLIAMVLLLVGGLQLRKEPMGIACPVCRVVNRYPARFCDTCGNSL